MANVGSVRNPQVVRINLDSDFSAGNAFDYTLAAKAEIVDVEWVRTDAVGGGVITLQNVAATVVAIGAPANQFDVVRAGNLQNVSVVAGSVLDISANLATIRGRLYITILPGI